MYIFISHSSKDAKTASDICEVLKSRGNSCFLAPGSIRPGYEYAEEIVNGIDRSDVMLVLLSENSNHSPHVLREVERAVSRAVPIIVYKLKDVVLTKSMEYFLMTHQWMNAADDTDYSSIVEAIDDLAAVRTGKSEGGTDRKVKNSDGGSKRWLAALIIGIALAAGTGLWLINKVNNADPVKEEENLIESDIKVGDTILLGQYNNEEIGWRVLKITDNEAVLIAENILTMKAFDAAESGRYNYDGNTDYWSKSSEADNDMELQARIRGNSDWSKSNIRAWLNSDKEVVAYEDQEPAATAMSELKNGYNNEAGFLYGFSEAEKSAIKETEIVTKGNALSEEAAVVSKDKVFLLSMDELSWFEEAGISMLAVPTGAAAEQDKTKWYQAYSLDLGVEAYSWWLREPVRNSASRCYCVGNGYSEDNMAEHSVGVEGFGIRPAITVDLQADCVSAGRK